MRHLAQKLWRLYLCFLDVSFVFISKVLAEIGDLIDDQQAMVHQGGCRVMCYYGNLSVIPSQFISWDIVVEAIFTTISLITGTGYTDTNYMLWGGSRWLFIHQLYWWVAGSTTCGIKIFRFQILYLVAKINYAIDLSQWCLHD